MPTLTAAPTQNVAEQLERHGIAVLPGLLSPDQLTGMQQAFARRLKHPRWNNVDGYEQTERFRHMVQDVLTLHQGFVDFALHPTVKTALNEYLGPGYQLCEAKGWLSLPTKRDFHGWHGDMWYDQTKVQGVPREVKLALYLTDVRSGAFTYIKGTHGRQSPRPMRNDEVAELPKEQIVEVLGQAGTAILFDTSGVHRQAVPMLEPRQAIFLNYHHPDVPLQKEDIDYYRYHPLLLNAAFLGDLTDEDRGILGFGDKRNYQEHFERTPKHVRFRGMIQSLYMARLWAGDWTERLGSRIRKLLRKPGG